MTKRLLFVFRGEDPAARPALADAFEAQGYRVDTFAVPHRARFRGLPAVLFSRRRFGDYDVVAAGEYNLTWALCLRLMRAPSTVLAAMSFNQSGRLILTGRAGPDALLNRVWRRVQRFVVHSREEARLFARTHAIPADRFAFAPWGYDLPALDPAATALPAGPYVSMIGRNNRDVRAFYRAVERAGVGGVVVTSAPVANALPEPPPPGVRLLVDIPMNDCLNYVAGSFAHLVLVMDGKRGAGHISAVSAMLLGKPQIFSRVAPLAEYLMDDVNGIAVPLGDAKAAGAAIEQLRRDPALADRLGRRGQEMARATMSHRASTDEMVRLVCEADAASRK